MNIKRTWIKFRLAAISIAVDDCLRREAQAQKTLGKLLKRERELLRDLPSPQHNRHIVTMPVEV